MYYSFTKKQNPEMLFVALAVSKDQTRPNLNVILSTGTEVVAVDGHRLHRITVDPCPLPEGLYEVKKQTKAVLELQKLTDEQASKLPPYPDYERIILRGETTPFPTRGDHRKQICIEGKYAEVIRLMGSGTLNYKYFEQANTVVMDHYQVKDGTSPILLTGQDTHAVITPLRYL